MSQPIDSAAITWGPHEETGQTSRSLGDRITERLAQEASRADSRVIVVEGPPLYLWPHPDFPVQDPTHPSFVAGWELLDRIGAEIPDDSFQHWKLVDDYNNRPDDDQVPVITEPVGSLFSDAAPRLKADRVFWESEFVDPSSLRNGCSNLDAAFQYQKLEAATDHTDLLRAPLMLVVHPSEFVPQQRQMLSHLLGHMKQEPFARMPKADRRAFIEETYRHVWISTEGHIEAYTRPVWDGNGFSFVEEEI